MKILILNWRSITDPLKGGAEVVTFEHAKRWVKKHSAEVYWISAKYDGNKDFEEIEGIKFIYIGRELKRDSVLDLLISFPIYFVSTYKAYKKTFSGKVDVVIDQIHGIPFLTPLYVNEKKLLFIHEVAGEIWNKMFGFPINKAGIFLEKALLKFYMNTQIVTVSESTRDNLVKDGFNKENIKIIHNGINLLPVDKVQKNIEQFNIIFLNRMVKMKGPERAINIFKKIREVVPNAKLTMIGRGEEEYINHLRDLIQKLNLNDSVKIVGFVSEEEKIELLKKANVVMNTSFKEGWGLVNIEANSQGTPVVAFNVEGCKDSIVNGVTGFLSENEEEFYQNILRLRNLDLTSSCIEYSKKFIWDEKAEEFYRELK